MTPISEKLTIQLLIGNQLHQFTIKREKEEVFRKAAAKINEKINKYKQAYQNQPYEKYLVTVLLDLGVQIVQKEIDNDTEPIITSMKQLTEEIEEILPNKRFE